MPLWSKSRSDENRYPQANPHTFDSRFGARNAEIKSIADDLENQLGSVFSMERADVESLRVQVSRILVLNDDHVRDLETEVRHSPELLSHYDFLPTAFQRDVSTALEILRRIEIRLRNLDEQEYSIPVVAPPNSRRFPGIVVFDVRGDVLFQSRHSTLKEALESERPDMDGANLNGAELSGIELEGVSFKGASLEEAKLQNAKLIQCDFTGCAMSGANFMGSDLSGSSFADARMRFANFYGATLQHCQFWDSRLQTVNMNRADLTGAYFDRAIVDADFGFANLQNAQFPDAKLYLTGLVGANLTNTNFEGVAIAWSQTYIRMEDVDPILMALRFKILSPEKVIEYYGG